MQDANTKKKRERDRFYINCTHINQSIWRQRRVWSSPISTLHDEVFCPTFSCRVVLRTVHNSKACCNMKKKHTKLNACIKHPRRIRKLLGQSVFMRRERTLKQFIETIPHTHGLHYFIVSCAHNMRVWVKLLTRCVRTILYVFQFERAPLTPSGAQTAKRSLARAHAYMCSTS